MQALKQAKGDVLAWTHADMQTDPNDVITAYEYYLKAIRQGAQGQKIFIKGRRRHRKLLEAFFTFGMQIIAWLVLKNI